MNIDNIINLVKEQHMWIDSNDCSCGSFSSFEDRAWRQHLNEELVKFTIYETLSSVLKTISTAFIEQINTELPEEPEPDPEPDLPFGTILNLYDKYKSIGESDGPVITVVKLKENMWVDKDNNIYTWEQIHTDYVWIEE